MVLTLPPPDCAFCVPSGGAFLQPTRRPVRSTSFPVIRSPNPKAAEGEGSATGVLEAEDSLLWNQVEYSPDGMGVADADPLLKAHGGAPQVPLQPVPADQAPRSDKAEGSLEQFSQGESPWLPPSLSQGESL